MRLYLDPAIIKAMPWSLLCFFALFMFLASIVINAFLIQQKRYRYLWFTLPLSLLLYCMEQCFDTPCRGYVYSQTAGDIQLALLTLPGWLLVTLCLVLALLEIFLWRMIYLYEKKRITPMSVKEAMDSLPAGILCYAPGAKTLLVNRTMEDLCRKVLGAELNDGAVFREQLQNGELLPECGREIVGGEPVITLPDGTVRELHETEIPYEKYTVRMLVALDITETFRKTQELTQMREKVEQLGRHLQKVNQEIVALTAEREILNAKVRIHDEMGSNLLTLKRYLTAGGSEKEKEELLENLRHSVSFLKNDPMPNPQDEYALLMSMAKRLGLTIFVTGKLPQSETHKPIITTAIHECLTNTLRHAHGNELYVVITQDEDRIEATLTNNGIQPEGEITEKGGLRSLRELTEQAGGTMTVETQPAFAIRIRLPKEDAYGL